jgi:inner membrane protein
MTPPRLPRIGKLVALGGVLLLLMLALHAVSDLVAERQGRLREAEASVAASLAAAQTIVGPLLQRDCVETWDVVVGEGKDRKTTTERSATKLAIAPAALEVRAEAAIEPRYRGIFKVNGYDLKARLDARWDDGLALVPERRHAGSRLDCDAPAIVVALGDARGVRAATVRLDGAVATVLPGTQHAAHPRGFHVPVAASYAGARQPLHVEVALEVVGTGELAFAPVADATRVELASDWPHPSFGGRFLPVERNVSEAGFKARWQLNALATTAPLAAVLGAPACSLAEGEPEGAMGAGRDHRRCIETFGVSFIDPVSPYVLSDRATKYGLLFIALTFVCVGAVEVMRRLRVHPVQYLLVGAGVAIFFMLLVSLSEHVAFVVAYAVAAAACTLLLGFYGTFVLGGARRGIVFGAGIGALYGVLYALLQLEQTALLLGSFLLFSVLAGIMVVTRRVDWYALWRDAAPGAPDGAQASRPVRIG